MLLTKKPRHLQELISENMFVDILVVPIEKVKPLCAQNKKKKKYDTIVCALFTIRMRANENSSVLQYH